MAIMEADEIAAGAKLINASRYRDGILEAASRAGGQYASGRATTDVAKWSKEEWRTFVWQIVSAGLHQGVAATRDGIRQAAAEVDEIPYT